MYGIYDGTKIIARFAAPMAVTSNRPVLVSDALSLRRTVNVRSAQRWEISSNVEPLTTGSNELFSLLVTKGNSNMVEVVFPQNYGVIKSRTSVSVAPVATGAAGATSVSVTGNAGVISQGTFIRFNNHTKIYMLTQTLLDNGTMFLYPELRTAVSATTFKHRDDVIMPALFDTDTIQGMSFSDGIMMDMGTIKLVEKL